MKDIPHFLAEMLVEILKEIEEIEILLRYLLHLCQRIGNGTILHICRSRSCLFHQCFCTNSILVGAGQNLQSQITSLLAHHLEHHSQSRLVLLERLPRSQKLPGLLLGLIHYSRHSPYFRHVAISFLGIAVTGTTLSTWCTSIIIVVTLI